MDAKEAAGWTLRSSAISGGAFLFGAMIALGGLIVASGDPTVLTRGDPASMWAAIPAGNGPIAIAGIVIGLVVWRVGAGLATFTTLPQASGERAADEYDTERVKSEILAVLDERLAEMHHDVDDIHRAVEETRRNVQELKREDHASTLAEETLEDDLGPGSFD